MKISLSPAEAWQPLPASNWDATTAAHLLRRAGWTARPALIDQAATAGLSATLDHLFPSEVPRFAKPRLVERLEEQVPALQRAAQAATGDEKLRLNRELQDRARAGMQELSLKWLQYAAAPENSAVAKWGLFLSDVYVVAADKVRNPAAIHRHFEVLTQHGFGPAPILTKAISRSPAMVQYLDLNQSQRRAPNENFARELFELFVLGEGNYTEQDIKEAARAFTGYRAGQYQTEFRFIAPQHDPTPKSIFGQRGNFGGDDVIDLAYRQAAAATFLPRELGKFYLSDQGLPDSYLQTLGAAWREAGFDLRWLARTFMGSRLFFAPEFRDVFIKSPIQFYLGLLQDLELQVAPIPRYTLNPLRQMGQLVFYPPNVRGWVGGRNWINAATLTARRQLVETLFSPLDERSLNADEQFELAAARSNGISRFTVADNALADCATLPPDDAAAALAQRLLVGRLESTELGHLRAFLTTAPGDANRRVRRAAVTLLQSPEYQLC